MEPIQDDIETNMSYDLNSEVVALRFSLREWKDKAQDKIAECEELVAERDRIKKWISKLLEAWDASEHGNVENALEHLRKAMQR